MPYYSDTQIGNIIFNETRSLSGTDIEQARVNIGHAIINAMTDQKHFPQMASANAKPGPGEDAIYAACQAAATRARWEVMDGKDPTDGARHFNFRKNDSRSAFQGHAIKTQIGPLKNSYPTDALPASGIYANTYE